MLEVHDFTTLDNSDDDDHGGPSSDSSGDGILGGSSISLCPWPWVFRLCGDVDKDGNHLPSLLQWGGGASWPDPPLAGASSHSLSSPIVCPGSRQGQHPRMVATTMSMGSTNGRSTMTLHPVSGDGCSLPGSVDATPGLERPPNVASAVSPKEVVGVTSSPVGQDPRGAPSIAPVGDGSASVSLSEPCMMAYHVVAFSMEWNLM